MNRYHEYYLCSPKVFVVIELRQPVKVLDFLYEMNNHKHLAHCYAQALYTILGDTNTNIGKAINSCIVCHIVLYLY